MKMRKYFSLMAALGLGAPCILSQCGIISNVHAGDVFGGKQYNMPPANRLAEPGPMVGGPGPGVLMPETIPVPNYGGACRDSNGSSAVQPTTIDEDSVRRRR